jgi:GntR family transcriptional regulator
MYERLYETGTMPHALVQIILPERLGERVSRADAATQGVYDILSAKVGIAPVRASFNIGTELPGPDLAQRLRVSSTTPLLVLERLSFDAAGETIERTVHHLRPDIYKLSVNVEAQKRPD